MFENPRRGGQARNFTTNVPKILYLKSSSEQIFSKNCRWVPLINLFERFIVYGLAKIQRDLKYPIACAPEYSRNLLSAQHFYLQSKDPQAKITF